MCGRSLQVAAETTIKKVAWLIFILGKKKILSGGEDIAELAYLLYACLYWVIMMLPKDVECDLLESKFCKLKPLAHLCSISLNFRIQDGVRIKRAIDAGENVISRPSS